MNRSASRVLSSLSISAVIPTRSRPIDLAAAVSSITAQIRMPDQVIIVDQSSDLKSKVCVEEIFINYPQIQIIYKYEPQISGLVEAKRASIVHATCDIICFLEDDIVLEPDYFKQVEIAFLENLRMGGCCGVVTNNPRMPFGYFFLFHLFHRGIFSDKRVGFNFSDFGKLNKMILCDKLSGGISSWRREIFSAVPFDVANGFHFLEDIEFSTRVVNYYGSHYDFFINPLMRLQHNSSQVNRVLLGERQHKKLIEFFLFYKKRRNSPWVTVTFLWLLVGLFIEALYQSISKRSMAVTIGFFTGICAGLRKKLICA